MPKVYELAPEEVATRAARLIEKYHRDLENANPKIDYIFARSPEGGNAVTHAGYPALAVVKIIGLKERAAGRGDAEILIDADAYESMSDERKDALLDHELYHLIVRRDDDGLLKTDDLNRPMFKMRKHDYQMGWFTSIAQRHGMNSPEVTQAQILWANDGQAYFPMLLEEKGKGQDAGGAKGRTFANRVSAAVVDSLANNPKQAAKLAKGLKSVTITGGGKSVTIDGDGA